ncbi:MAG: hypothetical protein ACRCUT_01965 [Spirochaetota bacterium]
MRYSAAFIDALHGHGFSAASGGIINSMCSRIEIFDGPLRLGMVDVYNKAKEGISPDFRGFKDTEIKEAIGRLWVDFLAGMK